MNITHKFRELFLGAMLATTVKVGRADPGFIAGTAHEQLQTLYKGEIERDFKQACGLVVILAGMGGLFLIGRNSLRARRRRGYIDHPRY